MPREPDSVPVPGFIEAAEIPEVIEDAPGTAYSKEYNAIFLGEHWGGTDTEAVINSLLLDFPKISFAEEEKDIVSSWIDSLPQELKQEILVVPVGETGNFYAAMPTSIGRDVVQYSLAHLSEWTFVADSSLVEFLIDDLKEEVKHFRVSKDLPLEVAKQIRNIRSKLWTGLRRLVETDENESFRERIRIHESVHSIDGRSELGGIPGAILSSPDRILPAKSADKREMQLVRQLKKARALFLCATEANATLHEILGSNVVENTDNYSHTRLLYRISDLLPVFTEMLEEGKTLRIEKELALRATSSRNGESNYASHEIGTLFLLMPDKIDPETIAEELNLSSMQSGLTSLVVEMLERVNEAMDDPEAAAEIILSSKEVVMDLLHQAGERFVDAYKQLISEYPNLAVPDVRRVYSPQRTR